VQKGCRMALNAEIWYSLYVEGFGPLWQGRSNQRKHAPAGCDLDEGLTALWQALMVARQTAPARNPGKDPFDNHLQGETHARTAHLSFAD